jgi:signal transduction histidine kinase
LSFPLSFHFERGRFSSSRRLLAVTVLLAAAMPSRAQTLPVATLTRAEQVRTLSVEEAAAGRPVRIRGVITNDVPAPDFFIQDATAGVYVEGSKDPVFPHRFGDLVELEGVTGPGKFAPVIREQRIRVLGRGTPPTAKLYSFSELAGGQLDSQWARIRGIVRSASIDRTSWQETTLAMRVASGGGEFNVRVPISEERDFSSWVDSEVLIEGVCGSLFNSQRQLIGVLFYVPRLNLIKVEATAKELPFSSLLRFSPGEGSKHRVHVRGVVGYQQPGKALFLQSGGKGLRVLTDQNTPLQIGDVVDVLGFGAMGESAPVLQDAVFHRIASGEPPVPVALNLDAPWEQLDGNLVTTNAVLLDHRVQSDGVHLTLRTGGVLFDASLQNSDAADRVLSIRNNSEVRVVGICLVRSGGFWSIPQSFRLLLRSPQDVVLVRAPSWWNLRHTMWVLAITVGALLIVLAWVVVLGRRLREQMAIIRQKLRSGAVLEERNRIARELHDTLEQELAGITMQLDLAADCFQQVPRVAHQALETARQMSRHSMVEARRSVWDLRCHLLESGDLVSALTKIVEPLAPSDRIQIATRIVGDPVRLPGAMEMNLLRIAQEAVANAVKHGGASRIEIELAFNPENVRLTISDDGQGFSPDTAARTGHFGLPDMRERAQSMGSQLLIDSGSGRGARLSVEVPISSQLRNEEHKTHSYSGRR